MESFESVCDYLKTRQPAEPVICHRPHAARRSASWFLKHFPGDVLYAVKANPSPLILRALYDAGIRHFDVSSPAEIELLQQFDDSTLYYMNPVKHPDHIRAAYFGHGIRHFSLDCFDELRKILEATDNADDLHLHVRLAVDNSDAFFPLTRKYGAEDAEAAELLVETRLNAASLGVCFHVGSQSMSPAAYVKAIDQANHTIRDAGVIIDSLDVGGGFPSAYPGLQPAPLADYMQAIRKAFDTSLTSETCALLAEPGRALVAEASSILVNITLRKHHYLYINDGAYGTLFDAAHEKFAYPVHAIREGQPNPAVHDTRYEFFGPTCDSIDHMTGPFMLPADMRAGDYIEIGQLGAYGDALRTNFNGFGSHREVIVHDEPALSLYSDNPADSRKPEQEQQRT